MDTSTSTSSATFEHFGSSEDPLIKTINTNYIFSYFSLYVPGHLELYNTFDN